MSQEQYNHYMTLATQYRLKGRNSIADALERQAQAELDKPAMDVSDIAMAEREKYNDPTAVAEPKKVTATVETPTSTTTEQQSSWTQAPAQNFTPTIEENMNQDDSEQFNVPQISASDSDISNGVDLGLGNTSAEENVPAPVQQPTVSRQSTLGRSLQQSLYGNTQNYGNIQEQPKKNSNGISQEQLDRLLELALNGEIGTY